MRTLTSGQQSAIADTGVLTTVLILLDFDADPVYLNISPVTITYDGHDWLAGQVVNIEAIKETDSGEATGFKLSLATTSEALIARALTVITTNRPCYVWRVFYNTSTGAIIDTPVLIEQGLCDQPTITEDGSQAVVAIAIETEMADFARPNILRYTNADHQARYPGDPFFEFTEQVVERMIAFPSVESQR